MIHKPRPVKRLEVRPYPSNPIPNKAARFTFLPCAERLAKAKEIIVDWWDAGDLRDTRLTLTPGIN